MDIYHVWCDLKPGASDVQFAERAAQYLGHLQEGSKLASFRITRRKLGLAPGDLFEFHLMLEFEDLAQLDRAFGTVAARENPVEGLHHAVNSQVARIRFALYRDFPDPVRKRGQGLF